MSELASACLLLDTNICIAIVEGLDEDVFEASSHFAEGELVTSSVCYAETLVGVAPGNSRVRRVYDAFFAAVVPLPFDLAAAQTYSRLPFKRNRYDRLVAAHALSLGVGIATINEKDFADIPGLKIENWAAS